jgi:Chaperone of endosialidase
MPYDYNGDWYEDTSSPDDWMPSGGYNIPSSEVVTNNDGSITVTNQDGSKSNYPSGSYQKDQWGNILDQFGNLIGPALSGLAGSALSPYLSNLATGGYLKKTADMLTGAGDRVRGIGRPDLLSVIPQLQQQVQQGTMTPAQYQASLAQIQGTMTPAQYQAALASVQGNMTPAQAEASQMEDSLMRGVNTDQQSLAGVRRNLTGLEDIAANKGLTEADRAQFAAIINQANAAEAQKRAAQIQQLQMQGNAGTGAELAARLSGSQQTANANALAGANIAQSAQARALQALQEGVTGNQALNTSLFSQDTAKAQAQDAVNQFNAQARNAVAQANAQLAQQARLAEFNTANQMALANQAAANQAGQYNAGNQQASNLANYNTGNQFALQNAQALNQAGQYNAGNQQASNLANFNMANTIGAKNTDIRNENLKMPYQATQANWTNALDQAKAGAGADIGAGSAMASLINPQINRANDQGAAAAKTTQPAPSSGGSSAKTSDWLKLAGNVIGAIWSDEDTKTDKQKLSDAEVDQMMGDLTGYKYRYKGDNNPQVNGVMAQDVEKGMPNSVVDTPAGKMIQKPEMMSNILAILANQHDRLLNVEGKK